MEAIELARQTAERLHHETVARGADPFNPYALVCALAAHLKLDVEPVAVGSAALDNARALFDPVGRAIQHEACEGRFEQAFLVAHEIGHVVLGDDAQPDRTDTVDPARSAEAAPVGEDRVVDYSRRQRREVQMDLFARELILPRSVARRLHLHEGLGATVIAHRLGAPFDPIAQQLLDGLLLPVVENEDAGPREDKPLNPAQKAAAEHRGEAYLLEAGPGTGKTQTLVARIEGLLDEDVDPRTILVLTFSNKAAGELSDRIAAKRPEAAAAMWIGTFHAFGLDLIRRFRAELGLQREPRMMDRTEAVELLEAEFPRLDLRHYRNLWDPSAELRDLLGAISRAQDEVVDAEGYETLARKMMAAATSEEARTTAEKALEVARVFACYERLKRATVAVDFGDLVAAPVRLLEGHAQVRAELQQTYAHILVDEYQDVNRSSVRLLTALCPTGRNFWAVGDARQSIYRFRGASAFNMVRFGQDDFPGGKRGRLEINYRSREEIVEAYGAFARDMRAGRSAADDGGADAQLKAERGKSGHSVEFRACGAAGDEVAAIVAAIHEMRQAGFAWRKQALLCSGNDRLARLGAELERRDVPVLYLGSLFERPEIKDLLAWLSLLIDRRAMGLARAGDPNGLGLGLADVAKILAHLKSNELAPMGWTEAVESIDGLSPAGHATMARLAEAFQGFAQDAQPWDVLARLLLDRTRVCAEVAAAGDVATRARGIAIWQFLNFVRAQPGGPGLPIHRLLERVRRLVRLADDRDLRQLPAAAEGIDAVRLMTMHRSKGLEFPVVHIPGMNEGTLPRSARAPACPPPNGLIEGGVGTGLQLVLDAHVEEQECLFYVALSRARDRLVLYAPTRNALGHSRPLSSYLSRLGDGLTRQQIAASGHLQIEPDDVPISLTLVGAPTFTQAQLGLYERCPRRFFYTHVLEVGGRRSTTPFMDMHDVVREVVEGVIAGPDAPEHATVHAAFAAAWTGSRAASHGYAEDYRAIAATLIDYFLESRAGHAPAPGIAFTLSLPGAEVLVSGHEILIASDGSRAVRQVRTGHRGAKDHESVAAAAFQIVANQAFPGCRVELVFLSDREATPVAISAKALANRRVKLEGYVAGIAAGRFPMEESSYTCPGCPAFFVCGPPPPGALTKKI